MSQVIAARPAVNFSPKCLLALNLFLLTNPAAHAVNSFVAAPSPAAQQVAQLAQMRQVLAMALPGMKHELPGEQKLE